MHRIRLALMVLLAFQASASFGEDVAVSADYLHGTWSLNGKEGCGSSDARYVLFRKNGTLEVGQGEQVQRVGFWHIVNDAIVANTLMAPNVAEDYHPFFRDSYRYEYFAPRVVHAEPGAFSVLIGSDLEKNREQVTLTRCP